MNTGMETMARKLLTEPYSQSQRNFEEIVDQFDRVYAQPLFENGTYYARNFKTLQACVDAAGDAGGGRVILQSGITYHEAIVMSQDHVCIWSPDRSVIIDGGTIGVAVRINGDYCSLIGMTLKTTAGAGNLFSCVYISDGVDRSLIEGVLIHGSDNRGIDDRGDFTIIRGTLINACDSISIAVSSPATAINIIDCCINDTPNAVHPLWLGCPAALIIGNVIGQGTTGSINLAGSTAHCTVGLNYCSGSILNQGTNNVVAHNA